MEAVARRSHAAADEHSRTLKARKIERLLGAGALRDGAALLDIGTGSGWIAHYFATHPRWRLAVSAVDANDERVMRDGYAFSAVTGAALPFLSWLPGPLANAYVRATGRGQWYDCRLLGPWQVRSLLRQAGLAGTDVGAEALVAMVELERPGVAWAAAIAGWIRRWAATPFGLLSPTLIFRVGV